MPSDDARPPAYPPPLLHLVERFEQPHRRQAARKRLVCLSLSPQPLTVRRRSAMSASIDAGMSLIGELQINSSSPVASGG